MIVFYKTVYTSPLGPLTLASDGDRLIGLWMQGQKYFGAAVTESLIEKAELPLFLDVKDWLDRYFMGEKPPVSEIPMAPIGGEFRQTVWGLLKEIPYGETVTYGMIARKTAERLERSSMSAQAVGGAVGHNPISILIPCHRVVGADGNLTGYAGGMEKKIWLLSHEGVDRKYLKVPPGSTVL